MRLRKFKIVFPSKKEAAFSNAMAAGIPLVLALMAAQFDGGATAKQIAEQPAFGNQPGSSPEAVDKAPSVHSAQWFNWANACLDGQWRNC